MSGTAPQASASPRIWACGAKGGKTTSCNGVVGSMLLPSHRRQAVAACRRASGPGPPPAPPRALTTRSALTVALLSLDGDGVGAPCASLQTGRRAVRGEVRNAVSRSADPQNAPMDGAWAHPAGSTAARGCCTSCGASMAGGPGASRHGGMPKRCRRSARAPLSSDTGTQQCHEVFGTISGRGQRPTAFEGLL